MQSPSDPQIVPEIVVPNTARFPSNKSAVKELPCPHCGIPMRPNANFCQKCGWELRPPCPYCNNRRQLATFDSNAPSRCPHCGVASFACNRCGRWLKADNILCPSQADGECNGHIAPVEPQFAGRTANGAGYLDYWSVPTSSASRPQIALPNALSERNSPTAQRRGSQNVSALPVSSLHAAFTAFNRFYLWADGTIQDFGDAMPGAGQPQLLMAGAAAHPGGASFAERVAIVNDYVVLATASGYQAVSLFDRPHPARSLGQGGGSPVAQAGWLDRWCGWIRTQQGAEFYAGRCEGNNFGVTRITGGYPETTLKRGARIVAHGDRALWPTEDGHLDYLKFNERGAPSLDRFCDCSEVLKRATRTQIILGDIVAWLVVENLPGPGASPQIDIYTLPETPGTSLREVHKGIEGPLKSAHAYGGQLIVVAGPSNSITLVDYIAELVHARGSVEGTFRNAIAVNSADRQPRLLLAVAAPSAEGQEMISLYTVNPKDQNEPPVLLGEEEFPRDPLVLPILFPYHNATNDPTGKNSFLCIVSEKRPIAFSF